MIIPGAPMTSGRLDVTISAGPTASRQAQGGFGLAADGTVAMDSNAPSGALWLKGFRVNATGCLFQTTATDVSDVWVAGIRCTAVGAIVTEAAAAVGAVNGDPFTANGLLAIG